MYQIKTVDGKRIINSCEIVAVGKGANGLCRVQDGDSRVLRTGTLAECEQYLRERSMLVAS